ncbi:hypothetical protein BHM03_00044316, partial [Ensete ventricosum]
MGKDPTVMARPSARAAKPLARAAARDQSLYRGGRLQGQLPIASSLPAMVFASTAPICRGDRLQARWSHTGDDSHPRARAAAYVVAALVV